MRAHPECAGCVLHDLGGALQRLDLSPSRKEAVTREALRWLARAFSTGREPSAAITEVHRILKTEGGIPVPFQALRNGMNAAGLELAERVRQGLRRRTGFRRFRALVGWSLAANLLDLRTAGLGYRVELDDLRGLLARVEREPLALDGTKDLWERLRGAKSVLFLHDNVGEIALDRLLVEFLREGGREVVSALPDGPITSDATLEDARRVGLDRAATRLVRMGPDTLGLSWGDASREMREALDRSDVVLAKGQAHWYALSEHRKSIRARTVACLLRTKCDFVAAALGGTHPLNAVFLL